jgi:hypothetical protein
MAAIEHPEGSNVVAYWIDALRAVRTVISWLRARIELRRRLRGRLVGQH